jgi:hypothetical protein
MSVAGRIAIAPGNYRGVIFAEMLMPFLTLEAVHTGSGPVEDNAIAGSKTGNLLPYSFDHTGSFVPHNDWFPPGKGVVIGMA